VVLLAGLTLGALSACDRTPPETGPTEPPAVGFIEAARQAVNPYHVFVGRTRAFESVEIRARVTGQLESRDFDEGGQVQAGQILFRIEPGRYQAKFAQAEAELAAAEADLNRARVDLARFEELLKANNVAAQQVDEARAEVLVRHAAVKTAKAAIALAQLDLDYTEIRAPIAGRIDIARYDVGNLVGPDAGVLARINLMDPMSVTFSISETAYLRILRERQAAEAAGEKVRDTRHVPRIRLPDGSIYEHPGEFDFIDNKVDEQTGTILVRAVFPNPSLLLPGQFVNVVLERQDASEAIVIPQAAVLTDQAGRYVLIVNDQQKIEVRRVVTGQTYGIGWEIKDGLAPADRVVLYGIQQVRPGLAVKAEPVEPTPAPVDESGSGAGAASQS
jgi:membrane fusion protein (multidrug efflux system)